MLLQNILLVFWCFLLNTLIKYIFCWRFLVLNEKDTCMPSLFTSLLVYEEYCECARPVSNSIYIVKTKWQFCGVRIRLYLFLPSVHMPLYRTVYVLHIHWHSTVWNWDQGVSIQSRFGSAVNIWNWLASHLGRAGGKGHCQRDTRERNSCFPSKYKTEIF